MSKTTTKRTRKTTGQFDAETSRKIRLATAREAKIAEYITKTTGQPVPENVAGNRRALIKLARELGWGWKGNVVNTAKKAEYGAAQTCGDDVAEVMSRVCRKINSETNTDYIDIDELKAVAKANGIDWLRWAHLNIGQFRMNLGNVLRGKVRKGEPVVIGNPKTEGKAWNQDAKAKATKKEKSKKAA